VALARVLLVAATDRELVPVDGADDLCCGIGPVEAALATAHALSRRRYDAVLHVGIARAQSLELGTIVIGTDSVYCDVIDANATLPRGERLRADPSLVAAAHAVLPRAQAVPIATCARVGGGTICEVEAMEGFGVLRAAALTGVPAIEVRTISNSVRHADRSLWQIEHALTTLKQAVSDLVPAVLQHVERR
jgi:futalosine hydrolase